MRGSRFLIGVLTVLWLPGGARAAGPLLVNGAGEAVVWNTNPIPFNPDRGSLGLLGNAAAVAQVTADFAVWGAVATSTLRFANAGALPVDVTVSNYRNFISVCGDGLSPIVFDTDGSITDDLLGAGSSNMVLGFAAPDCGTFSPPVITEGAAVLNGKFVDGIKSPSNPEVFVSDFDAVFIHEFGHYINLDHSQIGLEEANDSDPSNDNAIATMFPILENPVQQSTLNLDDQVSASMLYPGKTFGTAFGAITGSIFLPDGTTPFQGAYVIARKVDDPHLTAVGNASGGRFFPTNAPGHPAAALEGSYELRGLPPGSYTVQMVAIDPSFTNGSNIGPLDPPVELPGPPEFWNGVNESNADPPDDPSESEAINLAAGATKSGVNITINGTACSSFAAVTKPTIVIAKLSTPPGDDTLMFTGTMTLTHPFDPSLDPLSNGLRLGINDTVRNLLDVAIPAGAFAGSPGKGWKVNRNRTKWTYVDKTPAPLKGIVQVIVQDQSAQVPGRVKFSAKGKGGSYAVTEANLPLTGQIILTQAVPTTTQCGQLSFPGPKPAPQCNFNRSASKLTCK